MKKGTVIAGVVIIVILFISLIIYSKSSYEIEELDINNYADIVNKDGCSFIYTGDNTKEQRVFMKETYEKNRINQYFLHINKEQIETLLNNDKYEVVDDSGYIVLMNGEIIDYFDDQIPYEEYNELIDKYLYNKIPKKERKYKELSTGAEYIKKVNSGNYTVAVFGSGDCTYCDLYLPVINSVAEKYNVDIYYFDKLQYSDDDYNTMMSLDFEIPAKCTIDGKATTMTKGFPKPMTIITKDGKFVDCIRGYVEQDEVVSKLKEYKIIKES